MRRAEIYIYNEHAGTLTESDTGYVFTYSIEYLASESPLPISVTMPLREEPFTSPILHPFFDGLIPEGWTLNIAVKNWKLERHDRMGLLMACCRECIGAVSVRAEADING